MFELTDTVLQNRRFIITSISVSLSLLLVCLLAPLLQTYRANITARIQSSNTSQTSESTDEGQNAITNAFSHIASDIGDTSSIFETKMLSGVMAVSTAITQFDKATVQSFQDIIAFTTDGLARGVVGTVSSISDFTEHSVGSFFGLFHGLAHISSIIRPQDHTPIPVITQLRTQQAALIQSGTIDVSIASITNGVGGACDDGSGNGGYPMSWCNAPMDTYATLPYNNDPINRECTSYAYWYFTSIEGHTDFQAWGNAKYWASSSNYPTRTVPTVGAIAVETTGTYGHVAIVQALSGQKYAGQIVPSGYVLVSEMNYDWHGHFRYSYSPLSKFSAYIYP